MLADKLITLLYQNDLNGLSKEISQGETLTGLDRDGRSLLMHAVLASDANAVMVRFLLQNGADAEVQDKDQKWTALHFAARDQKKELVAVLLDYCSNVDVVDSFGNTPLWRAVMTSDDQTGLIESLVNKGADPNKKNNNGVSPRDLADRLGKSAILDFFDA